jgi:hypothetical protein
VVLDGNAPQGGTTVTLASSDPSSATVSPNVTVPAGQSTIVFEVDVAPFIAPTDATITAKLGRTSKTATLSILRLYYTSYLRMKSTPAVIDLPANFAAPFK